jgi:hypothetical protein
MQHQVLILTLLHEDVTVKCEVKTIMPKGCRVKTPHSDVDVSLYIKITNFGLLNHDGEMRIGVPFASLPAHDLFAG